jgi:osmotically-inducible protein OsmY
MRYGIVLLAGLILTSSGCKRQDAEHLSRIGDCTLGRLEGLAGGSNGKLASGMQGLRGSLGKNAVDSRVALRLSWDRLLSGTRLSVSCPAAGVVELRGVLSSAMQQRRAVELARSTQGVEQVVDALTVEEKVVP